jgi:hypothetical protein
VDGGQQQEERLFLSSQTGAKTREKMTRLWVALWKTWP